MVRRITPAFRTFRIDLSAARIAGNAEPLDFAGSYWYVVDASSDGALAAIALDVNNQARLPASLHRGYRSTASFERLWIFNAAQSGDWIDLVVAQDPGFEIIAQAGRSAEVAALAVSQVLTTEIHGNKILVQGSAIDIAGANQRTGIIVRNAGAGDVRIGYSMAEVGGGNSYFLLKVDEALSLPNFKGGVYAIRDAAVDADVYALETYA